jgi:branched-chain amino acid transport system ATP-binding protein
MTIVLVEQQIERALDFADQAIVIERGKIVWSGDPAELRAAPELISRLLGVGVH